MSSSSLVRLTGRNHKMVANLADILCSTASIWNLSIVGLDRYYAITSPVSYMAKRNKKTAGIMILRYCIRRDCQTLL